ncbi:MAG: cell division protein FtsQ/DivIB [bacterium]
MRRFRKSYKKANKKPLIRSRFFWLSLLTLLLAGGVFYLINFHSFFQIKEIAVFGNTKVPGEDIEKTVAAEIEKKVFFLPSQSIFLADFNGIKKRVLNDFPQIARVEIERLLPESLRVNITEKTAAAVWRREDKCFLLDQNGVIFEESSVNPIGLVEIKDSVFNEEIKLGATVINKQRLSQILALQKNLAAVEVLIRQVSIVSVERLDIETAEGWQVYFNLQEDIEWQMTELNQLLEKMITLEEREGLEYIDLRFEKAYFKMRKME